VKLTGQLQYFGISFSQECRRLGERLFSAGSDSTVK